MAVASEAITRFLGRVNQANRSKGREVVLTMEDAVALTTGITSLLNENSELMRQVIDLQSRSPVETIQVDMDGGGFR
jgi:hypothetical protein